MNASTEFDLKEMGARIRNAREAAGLSRADLSKATGIPHKAIEKFEYGSQEPSITRIKKICDALNVHENAIVLGDEEPPFDVEPASNAGMRATPTRKPAAEAEKHVPEPRENVRDLLARLDDMRFEGFDGTTRSALALIDDIRMEMRYLEPEELLELAQERKLLRGSCASVLDLENLFGRDIEAGQKFCGNVEERIIDTAVLGIDLFRVDQSNLAALANDLADDHESIERPGLFGSWGGHERLAPMLRPILRHSVISGNPIKVAGAETLTIRLST